MQLNVIRLMLPKIHLESLICITLYNFSLYTRVQSGYRPITLKRCEISLSWTRLGFPDFVGKYPEKLLLNEKQYLSLLPAHTHPYNT